MNEERKDSTLTYVREGGRESDDPSLNGALVTTVSATELPSRPWIQLTCCRGQWLLSSPQCRASQKREKNRNVPNDTLNGPIITFHGEFLQGETVLPNDFPFPCRTNPGQTDPVTSSLC